MDEKKFITAPLKTDRMPPGIPYIIGNEAAERFNFYGMRSILVVFMTGHLLNSAGEPDPMTPNEAKFWYHIFMTTSYALPVFGALLADVFWGKYRTILWLSLVYCLGSIVLAFDHTRTGLFLGLGLFALGAGGIKPCVSAHVGDQFGSGNQHLLSRAFGWFYFAINSGSSIAIALTSILLVTYGAGWAFGVPAALMLLATFVFWLGRYKFAHIPPAGASFFRENFNREGLAILARLTGVYVFIAVFWSLYDQHGGEWVLQAAKMDREIDLLGLHFTVQPGQVQVLNGIFILTMIPVCTYWLYPAIGRFLPLTPLRKIGLGFGVTASAFLLVAWIESRLNAGQVVHVAWQAPAFLLLSLGEVMVSVTSLEFAYTQAPRKMKSAVMCLYLLAISAGNLFTSLVYWFIGNPDGTAKITGVQFNLFFAGLCLATMVVFALFARGYTGRTILQDDTPAAG